jgi:hypothetical protein
VHDPSSAGVASENAVRDCPRAADWIGLEA